MNKELILVLVLWFTTVFPGVIVFGLVLSILGVFTLTKPYIAGGPLEKKELKRVHLKSFTLLMYGFLFQLMGQVRTRIDTLYFLGFNLLFFVWLATMYWVMSLDP